MSSYFAGFSRRAASSQTSSLFGFSAVDFAYVRYGRLMHLYVTGISCFYMYIYVVAELTTIANVYATFVGKSTAGDDSQVYTRKISAIVVIVTWAYTALAGLPASILTDKFQGVTIMAFVIMLLVAALTLKSNEVSKKEFDESPRVHDFDSILSGESLELLRGRSFEDAPELFELLRGRSWRGEEPAERGVPLG